MFKGVFMKRREALKSSAALSLASLWLPAMAHHGWSSFDQDRPIYLEGKVVKSTWQNPHAELLIDLPAGLKLPVDLAQRPLPAQTAPVDGKALLAKAVVPTRQDKRWEIELAPLSRMQTWNVAEIKPGDSVALLGFTFTGEKGAAILRVEYLFVAGKTYALRSSPA
jgi:Family of unknown function (DUF6152)